MAARLLPVSADGHHTPAPATPRILEEPAAAVPGAAADPRYLFRGEERRCGPRDLEHGQLDAHLLGDDPAPAASETGGSRGAVGLCGNQIPGFVAGVGASSVD